MKLLSILWNTVLYVICFFIVFNLSKQWFLDVNVKSDYFLIYFIAYYIILTVISYILMITIKETIQLIFNNTIKQ